MIVIKFGRHDNQPKGPETDERRKTQKRKEIDQNFKLASPGKQTTRGLRGDWNTHNVVRQHHTEQPYFRRQDFFCCDKQFEPSLPFPRYCTPTYAPVPIKAKGLLSQKTEGPVCSNERFGRDYAACLALRQAMRPTKPVPKSRSVEGSGTG